MIIPCIDLMDGRVVQLVRGQREALSLPTVADALEMFRDFDLLHVIDLDAALGRGNNVDLVREVIAAKRVRVGGGIRSVEAARAWVEAGAEQVIVGTSAFTSTGIDEVFLGELSATVGQERIVIAMDVKHGRVAVKGWTETLAQTPERVANALAPYCAGLLCTYVDQEGTMQGTDLDLYRRLREATTLPIIAAGGIGSLSEVQTLLDLGYQVALGMSIYTGRLDLADLKSLEQGKA